jgi:DNA-binding CsgD family transcriptional regulator
MADLNILSERELEILCLLAKGKSNKEIAQELFISINTVKVHLRNVFAKLEVSSRTEATLFAVRAGLVEGVAETGTNGGTAPVSTPTITEAPPEEVSPPTFTPLVPEVVIPARKWWQRPWIFVGVMGVVLLLGIGLSRLLQPTVSATPEIAAPPSETGWETQADLSFARFGHATTVYENEIFVIGGETAEGVIANTERYNPETDQWTTLPEKPTAVTEAQAAVLGGKIYVPGGRMADGTVTDLLEVFDPLTNRWEIGPSLPGRVSGYALTAFEGKLYLFGGWDGEGYSDRVLTYSADLEQWAEVAHLPSPRGFASAMVGASRIYVLGGYDGKEPLDSNLVFFPGHESESPWESAAAMPGGRYAMGVTFIADKIYVMGGIQQNGKPAPQLTFLPQSDGWIIHSEPEETNSLIWSHFGVAVVGANVYAMGGIVGDNPTSQNIAFKVIYTFPLPLIIK